MLNSVWQVTSQRDLTKSKPLVRLFMTLTKSYDLSNSLFGWFSVIQQSTPHLFINKHFALLQVLHRRLAVQLCGLFAAHDSQSFVSRLGAVLPHIVREVRLEVASVEPTTHEGQVKSKELQRDHHLYQLLHLLVKLCTLCPNMLTESGYVEMVQSLAGALCSVVIQLLNINY